MGETREEVNRGVGVLGISGSILYVLVAPRESGSNLELATEPWDGEQPRLGK